MSSTPAPHSLAEDGYAVEAKIGEFRLDLRMHRAPAKKFPLEYSNFGKTFALRDVVYDVVLIKPTVDFTS